MESITYDIFYDKFFIVNALCKRLLDNNTFSLRESTSPEQKQAILKS